MSYFLVIWFTGQQISIESSLDGEVYNDTQTAIDWEAASIVVLYTDFEQLRHGVVP